MSVDCAVHPALNSVEALHPYLPEPMRRRHASFGRGALASGGVSLDEIRRDLDARGLERAVLVPKVGLDQEDVELEAALARAVNDWLATEWLERDQRLRGSFLVPGDDPSAAVDEIGRRANQERWVQLQLSSRARAPLGDRRYRAVLATAASAGLVLSAASYGRRGFPASATGWPSSTPAEALSQTEAAQAHVVSLVCSGALAREPALRVAAVGVGVGWLPPLAWRLDASWRLLREEVPEVELAPSEYLRRQLWVAPDADDPSAEELSGQLGYDDRLVGAGGIQIADERLASNARALYGGRL